MKLSIFVAVLVLALTGCGGGSGGDGGATVAQPPPAGGPQALEAADVQRILNQAVFEAQARGLAATIAVVDRPGNVLAVYRMAGAAATFTISGGRALLNGTPGVNTLETINTVPSEFAAISKAITGAYLSSGGNAFSTRTASQIVQHHFPIGQNLAPGGPLFGVQFSQLSCSDVVGAPGTTVGPRGSPLGLAADPGGLPLYKNGVVVGGIGVIADGTYGLDLNDNDFDQDIDELIAVAGTRGFDAPGNIRADRISVGPTTLNFVDSEAIVSDPASAPDAVTACPACLIPVTGYRPVGAPITPGTAFGTTASGFRPDTTTPELAGLNAWVLDDGAGVNRYPTRAGTEPGAFPRLTQPEVVRILAEAIKIANRARAQIRQPLGSPAQVTMSVVDTTGAILGVIRTPDAPVFGTDVSVQKARTALFFSLATAGATLAGLPGTIPGYATAMQNLIQALNGGADPLVGNFAFTSRAIGNLARPFLEDGNDFAAANGPLSRPFAEWSPFADGLQLDLVIATVVGNIGAAVPTVGCSPVSANGIQIFPGSVPIYRGGQLVGAIGISGDGVDQDDMVAFLGLANAATALGSIGHAPMANRADQLTAPAGLFLRYVSCPLSPFLDTTATNVCNGI